MQTTAEAKNDGYEWRILLGPCHDWPVFGSEPNLTSQKHAVVELCELCREPIDRSKPFTTNSAGQQPIHTECLSGDEEPPTVPPSSKFRMWGTRLMQFLGLKKHTTLAPVHNE